MSISAQSKYLGVDIVPALIVRNRQLYQTDQRTFAVQDITKDWLPDADVILCRDCLIHLSFTSIKAAISNFKKTSATHLLCTTREDAELGKMPGTRASLWHQTIDIGDESLSAKSFAGENCLLSQFGAQLVVVRQSSRLIYKSIDIGPPISVDFIRHDLFLPASRINDRHSTCRHRFNSRNSKMFLFRGVLIGVNAISGRMPVNRCAAV